MEPKTPPPLPPRRPSLNPGSKVLIALSITIGALVCTIIGLRLCGLLYPLFVPTGAMTPAVSSGDRVIMEGVSFLSRQPRRGDIVVFKTDGIASLQPSSIYIKRVAGEPGEHIRISEGKLFVNDRLVSLSNEMGQIEYNLPPNSPNSGALQPQTELKVPEGSYFVLGDNSTNSLDSRFFGSVPRGNIMGRVLFCYWPPQRAGSVK